jgi:endonuclease YncB( thermonuclease family)
MAELKRGEAKRRWGVLPWAVVLALATLLAPLSSTPGKEVFTGPVQARVLAVLDGDTLSVAARVWLGQEIAIRVRLAGVDAPEITSDCARERRLARAAKRFLKARAGTPVVLHDIRYGKYAGRVLARVESDAGEDLGAALLAAGYARVYRGGRRSPWCVPLRARR